MAASTQNQAFNALLFLYHEVLHQAWGELGRVQRAKRTKGKNEPPDVGCYEIDQAATLVAADVRRL